MEFTYALHSRRNHGIDNTQATLSLYNEKDNAARRESAGQGAFFPYKVRREWTPRVYPPKRPKRVCLTNLITKAGYDHFHVEVSILTSQYTGQEEKSSNMFVMFHL